MVTIDISQASELQSAIQKQLGEYGYSPDDDPVMAEYVTVMLANQKSGSQITTELSDLIGPEYDPAFTDWIFDTAIPEHYGGGSSGAGQHSIDTPKTAVPGGNRGADAQAQNQQSQSRAQEASPPVERIQTVGDSREGNYGARPRHGLPSRPAGMSGNGSSVPRGPGNAGGPRGQANGVFGTAMAGLKREHDSSQDRGPNNNRRPRMSSENEQQNGERSIFDRAGVRAGTAQADNFNNMGGFGNGRNNGGPGRRGGPGGPGFQQQQMPGPGQFGPQIPGLPALHIPDNFNSLPPAQQQAIQQQIFQHQLIAAAAAQQMYTGGTGGPQGGPAMGMQPPQFPGMMQNGQQSPAQPMFAPQQTQQQGQQQQPRAPKPVKLPPRPTSEELCKYGVECKNAVCRYSHPSPAATKESGLVLSKEVCEKGLDCDDKDCPKSHVSPAQKTDPQGLNVSQYKQKAKQAAPAPVVAVPVHVPAANPGAKPCMFGAACTRPGCFFSHPVNNTATPCRFGVNCTRKDCHFAHPEGRKIDTASPSVAGNNYPSFTPRNMSATFGSAKSPTVAENGSAAKPNEADQSKMSARMKRFTESGGNGEAERIVGGKQESSAPEAAKEGQDAKDKDDDLEVVI